MDDNRKPSRREMIAKGVAAVGAAVAAGTVGAEATQLKLRPAARLRLNNVPRARMSPEQLRKDDKARQATLLLRELGADVQIQWVQGPKLGRRIIQMNG